MRRIRVVLYLRANQLRIQLYRPVLFSITSILENRGYASTCVEIAKDTIQVLTRLNQISDLYSTQQVSFHYFLILALGVLLLAVAHAPAEFSQNVRDEFYMALDLVKGFSSKSYLSSRLWRTIKGLKEIAPKLGLISGQALAEANDPHSSAAVAMAGLAGHQVQMYPPGQTMPSIGNSPVDGQQMSFELTNLFEVAGGYGVHSRQDGMMVNGMGGGPQGEMVHGGESLSMMMNGNDDDFLRIMKECF